MAMGAYVGNNFPHDSRFSVELLILIDSVVTACDAALADPDLEAEEDCCAAADDLGSARLASLFSWAHGVCIEHEDAEQDVDDEPTADDEKTAWPGFLGRNGAWRGWAIPFSAGFSD